MTTIVGTPFGATNVFDSGSLEELAGVPLKSHSSTQFLITNSDVSITGIGTGLTYSSGHPSGGTITSLTVDVFGYTSTWSGFSVSASTLWHAVATGDTGTFNSLLFGGDDTFTSGATGSGSDNVAGYAGNDIFNLGASFSSMDHIDGGTGNDTVTLNGDYAKNGQWTSFFSSSLVSVETVSMAAGHNYSLQPGFGAVVAGQTMTFDASALHASDAFAFDGNSNAGNFILKGGAGNDTFTGGTGNDTFTGGAGSDTVVYSNADAGLHIDLGLHTAQAVGDLGSDTLISIENIDGSRFNDTLTGNAGNNYLNGDDGSDVLFGRGGNDDLVAAGYSGQGTDIMDGGPGNDILDGSSAAGGEIAIVSYQDATGGVTVDFSQENGQHTIVENVGGGEGTDTLIDIYNLIGSAHNDVLTTAADTRSLNGAGGNDTLDVHYCASYVAEGGAGNDVIIAGLGFIPSVGLGIQGDQIDGGAGIDTVKLSGDFSAGFTFAPNTMVNVETLQLAAGDSYKLTSDDATVAAGQRLTVDGSGLLATDKLTFDGSHETDGNLTLIGGAGDDVLIGGLKNDVMTGNGGNDSISLGAAFVSTDKINGGTGTDTVSLAGNYSAGVNFMASTMINVETLMLGAGFNYKLTTNDATVASGATLTVNGSALGAGNFLTFNGAAETNGHFNIEGGLGADILTGGALSDTFVYTSAAQSSGVNYDTIHKIDFSSDRLDVSGTISAIAATIHASLSTASFDTDLANAVSGHLVAGSAMLVGATAGTLTGQSYLVIDQNGVAGYQSGSDLVIDVTGHIGVLATGDFI